MPDRPGELPYVARLDYTATQGLANSLWIGMGMQLLVNAADVVAERVHKLGQTVWPRR
jgi:hypothetical protein